MAEINVPLFRNYNKTCYFVLQPSLAPRESSMARALCMGITQGLPVGCRHPAFVGLGLQYL